MLIQTMPNLIDPYVLLAIGVVLVALEAVITSFIVIWFGIGFIIVGIISKFYAFDSSIWQLSTIAIISLILLVLLRKKILEKFLFSQEEVNDNFLDEKGEGIIKSKKVFYKGTFWEIQSNLNENEFEEDEKVVVLGTHKNHAKIEKIENN